MNIKNKLPKLLVIIWLIIQLFAISFLIVSGVYKEIGSEQIILIFCVSVVIILFYNFLLYSTYKKILFYFAVYIIPIFVLFALFFFISQINTEPVYIIDVQMFSGLILSAIYWIKKSIKEKKGNKNV